MLLALFLAKQQTSYGENIFVQNCLFGLIRLLSIMCYCSITLRHFRKG